MKFLVLLALISQLSGGLCNNDDLVNRTLNSTESNKDMYVIHAMVYQVGIITNKTDENQPNSTMGNQEALTLYRNNGSKIDLSEIPAPLLTNLTAQSIVQVAPKVSTDGEKLAKLQITWKDIKSLAAPPKGTLDEKLGNTSTKVVRRSAISDSDLQDPTKILESELFQEEFPRNGVHSRSVNLRDLFKRELYGNNTSVRVEKGAVVIPQTASVQSIAIPPLLTLNNNLSDIPVPIPNTSLVHYAKINTVVRKA